MYIGIRNKVMKVLIKGIYVECDNVDEMMSICEELKELRKDEGIKKFELVDFLDCVLMGGYDFGNDLEGFLRMYVYSIKNWNK